MYMVVCYPTHMSVQMQVFITNTHAGMKTDRQTHSGVDYITGTEHWCSLSVFSSGTSLRERYRESGLEARNGTMRILLLIY